MNYNKPQPASSKLQGNTKSQFPDACADALKYMRADVLSFFGVWVWALGAFCSSRVTVFANPPSLSGLPLFFEPQQVNPGVGPSSFLARGQKYQFRISATGADIAIANGETASQDSDNESPVANYRLPITSRATRETQYAARCLRLQIVGANTNAEIHGEGALGGKMNYFIGNDPVQWRRGLPIFSKVQLDEVYPGISLCYYGNQHQLEYDFVVAPGADPENIALHFDGVDNVEINKSGELVLVLGDDEIRFHHPVLYQELRGMRQPVVGSYKLKDAQTAVFEIGRYDRKAPLVIDPVLSYSTYFGGNFGDIALGVKVDTNGIYLAGETFSTKFPFPLNGFDTTFNGGRINGDAFVAKLSNDASSVLYFTYIGGHEDDGALDLAIDANGNAYITGFTDSTNFPFTTFAGSYAVSTNISGARDKVFHSYPTDAIIVQLDRNGQLAYSTYLGGSGADVAGGIAVDSMTNIYITGYTFSTDFPATNSPLFTSNTIVGYTSALMGSNDIFVVKVNPASGLLYSSLFGGSNLDEGQGIVVDDQERVYVTGFTGSTNFFTSTNALPGTNGLGIRLINGHTNPVVAYRGINHIPFDAFLLRVDTKEPGTNHFYSTLFGGRNDDAGFRLALYSNTDVLITGNSHSPDFLTNDFPAQPRVAANAINSDAFLTKFRFNPADIDQPPTVVYSSLFGGSGDDIGWDLALDEVGNIFIVGITSSGDFPTTNGAPLLHTNHIGFRDVFVTAFNNDASAILYSVEVGGSGDDYGFGIAADSFGNAYIVGRTVSANFPVTNAWSGFYRTNRPGVKYYGKRYGTNDAFLAKIVLGPNLSISNATDQLELSWPASVFSPEFGGYHLETTTNWITFSKTNGSGADRTNTTWTTLTNWVPVTLPRGTNNGRYTIDIPTSDGFGWFRLRR